MASSPNHESHRKFPNPEELANLPEDGGPDFNRLVFEASPYLQQHASNPVDWYPWTAEAFDKARREDKPIFLSIGYATCHWCHVMERESFEDDQVASLINTYFVPIKVDREERPDIDHVYMTACQAATGSGGWPLTAFLDHDLNVFFVGTYFPKTGGYNRPGLLDLLPRITKVWKTQRDELHQSARKLTAHLQQLAPSKAGATLDARTLDASFRVLHSAFDAQHGGFGSAPKFPTPQNLIFLLRYWYRTGNPESLEMVKKTLLAMRRGGIYDQIGFGFHRYSTDRNWLVPHFEKMLYDQALMAMAYIETFQATGHGQYGQIAREILDYVLREMTSPEGGFFSAEDADSEGVEGKFYVWSLDEIRSVLDEQQTALVVALFNVSKEGNFAEEATRQKSGYNILHLTQTLDLHAKKMGLDPSDLRRQFGDIRQKMFAHREKRVHPFKDDKILTDWNGLMISACARAGRALDDTDYIQAAKKAADFVLTTMRNEQGRLLKRYRNGQAGLPAHVDDYAFLVAGLLDVYEATFEIAYLKYAVGLTDHALSAFWDDKAGGFFLTANDGEKLILRSKEIYDGALPSGNSVFAMNLLRLHRMTGRKDLLERANQMFQAFSALVSQSPMNYNQFLCALDFSLTPSLEIVIAGSPGKEDVIRMARTVFSQYLPNKVVLFRSDDAEQRELAKIAPFTTNQSSQESKATAFVCRDFACQAPTTDISELKAMLASNPSPTTPE